jgi:hypothetical protein
VRNYVVQLPRDPRTLLEGCGRSVELPRCVEPLGPLAVSALARSAGTHHPAKRVRRQHHEQRREDRGRGRLPGNRQLVDCGDHHREHSHRERTSLGRERAHPVENQEQRLQIAHRLQSLRTADYRLRNHETEDHQHQLERPATTNGHGQRKHQAQKRVQQPMTDRRGQPNLKLDHNQQQ